MSLPIIKKQIQNSKPELWELTSALIENRTPRLHRDQVERFFQDLNDIEMLERTIKILGCDDEIRSAKEKEIKIIEEEIAFLKKKEDKDILKDKLDKLKKEYYMLLFTILNDEDQIPPSVKKLWKDIKKGQTKIDKSEQDKKTISNLLKQWGLSIKDFKLKLESLLEEFCIEDYLKPIDYNEDVDIEWEGKVISLTTSPIRGVFFVDSDRKTIYSYQFEINGNIISVGSNTIYYICHEQNDINSMELTRLYKLLFDDSE